MAKINMEGAKEFSGALPLGDYIWGITEIERVKNRDGYRQYIAHFEVAQPKELAKKTQRDWFTVGTEADPMCKQAETTEDPSNVGVGRLKRLLNKSHTAVTNDDEQWMEEAVGNEVGAVVRSYKDREGVTRTSITYEFSEDVEPGLVDEDAGNGKAKPGKRGPAQAARAMRSRGKRRDEDDDLDDEDEKRDKKGLKSRDDDDDLEVDEEEDEVPPKKGKAKEDDLDAPRKGKPSKDDDDEDDDDEEEEEEPPKRKRGRPPGRLPGKKPGRRSRGDDDDD